MLMRLSAITRQAAGLPLTLHFGQFASADEQVGA